MTSALQRMLNSSDFKSLSLKDQTAATQYGYSLASSKLKSVQNTLMSIAKIVNIPANLSAIDIDQI